MIDHGEHDGRDERIVAWLEGEAPDSVPDIVLRAAFTRTQAIRQRPRRRAVRVPATSSWAAVALTAAAVVVAAFAVGVAWERGGGVGAEPAAPSAASPAPPLLGIDLPGEIVVVQGSGARADLFSIRLDGSRSTRLTTTPGAERDPAWSSDGAWLVFGRVSGQGGQADLFKVRADGTDERRLTDTPQSESAPAFSPDGVRIAFARGGGDTPSELYVMDADGAGMEQVYVQPTGYAGRPVWSPDGNSLYFNRDLSAGGGAIDIARLDLASGEVTDITSYAGDDSAFALSPDGARIAFQSDRSGGGIFVMASDGSSVAQLVDGLSRGLGVDWSPDGSHLVYAHPDGWLYVVPASGGEPVRWSRSADAAWMP